MQPFGFNLKNLTVLGKSWKFIYRIVTIDRLQIAFLTLGEFERIDLTYFLPEIIRKPCVFGVFSGETEIKLFAQIHFI